jgi:RHH-type transcriptional regulator, proline utilization regulon repressor / proline dehydrogenase / delta 1-pyrroline-5-carboxylate dehydrogenase
VLALASLGARVLVYAPIVQAHEFPSAIAYLTRRLDENTSAENYLAHSFDMQFDTPTWHTQRALFLRACGQAETVSKRARRIQDLHQPAIALGEDTPFRNEADTDFGLAHNRRHVDEWLQRTFESTFRVASSFGQAGKNSAELQNGFDPSRPGHVPYAIALADEGVIEECLARAVTAAFHNPHDAAAREAWLRRVAQSLRRSRGELIALMVLDAGKRVEEADVEVSEAIDFAEYYLRCHRELRGDAALARTPHGVVVVTPPWNFPLAIGIGGVLAALVAGNAVILKPPMETPLVQQRACELLWESGVPEDLLQFVVCRDEVGSKLIKDPRTECVVLTGSTNTARLFRDMRPDFHLFAETGGKNALIVSAMSDREQAIADIVASAFGHAGQKCSALSQLILEREVYEDAGFLKQLKDATESLNVGSAWDKTSVITPLIQEPSPQQLRALTTLDEGERWLVQPRFDAANPRLVSPGIKLGVTVGSFSHLTEFFCPLLSVLVAKDLAAAVRIANATPYGLTAGLHSLDEREHEYFIDQIQAGNVYINRRITGAIVQRQPFGGWKASSFGPGAKAGGPNYVAQFVELAHPVTTPSSAPPGQGRAETSPLGTTHAPASTPRRSAPSLELALPTDVDRLLHQMSNTVDVLELQPIADEFLRLHTRWYASPHDDVELLGEDNLLCYKPLAKLLVIADLEMSARDLALIALAATTARCPFAICAYPQSPAAQLAHDIGATQLPSDEAGQLSALFDVVGQTAAPRVRCKTPLPAAVLSVAHERDLHVVNSAVTVSRFELLNGLREQSVTVSYHRHGHTGLRGLAHRNEAPPSSSRRADGPG